MAPAAQSEYTGKTEAEKKALKTYLDSLNIAQDYCRPYFEKFVRWHRLFMGYPPPELDGTFSKVMLNIAIAMVENELPKSARALQTTDWFHLEALDPANELNAQVARKWLRYQMETVQRIGYTSVPTLQQTHVFGTGYRVYGHKIRTRTTRRRVSSGSAMGIPFGFKDKEEETRSTIVSGQYAGVFDIMPLPGGGQVNAFDDDGSACVDRIIHNDYVMEAEVQGWLDDADSPFNKNQIRNMMKPEADWNSIDPTDEFKNDSMCAGQSWMVQSMPEWMRTIRNAKIEGYRRFRIDWLYGRDNWLLIGEDRFVIYDGPPLFDAIPVAKFCGGFSFNDFFGNGLIGISEDLILSIMLIFSQRLDYLAQSMNQSTWVSERVLEGLGGDRSRLDPAPGLINTFPNTVKDIAREVYREQYAPLTQQAFIEDKALDQWVQKITGQTNYGSGVPQPATPGESATGILSILSQGNARSMMRACNIEESGYRDSLYLTLLIGNVFTTKNPMVRVDDKDKGWPWEELDFTAINPRYNVTITGSRNLNMAEETFRKMNAVAQTVGLLIANPRVPKDLIRQILLGSHAFEDVDAMFQEAQQLAGLQPQGLPQPVTQPGQSGGPGNMGDMMNQTATAAGGAMQPAGAIA